MSILSVELRLEHHLVLARQRARQIAGLLAFDSQEQTRIATAVSEVARNALRYAGGGRVQFDVRTGSAPLFLITVRDQGPGIIDLQAVLDGRYASTTGMGLGLAGSRRLMDYFRIESAPGKGTTVELGKLLPPAAGPVDRAALARIAEELAREAPRNPLEEVEQQNQELLLALEQLRARQEEIERLNRTLEATNQELAETNRGMVALYAELDDRADELRRASELKSRFLSYISHEFRTPLGSMLRLSQFLLDRLDGDLTPEQDKQVRLIRKASEGLAEMVNDLLDLGKIEAGKITIQPARVEVDELFSVLRGMFRPLVVPGHVELIFEGAAGIPPLLSDEGKVSQILRNFISNALKFTPAGEVRVRAVRDAAGGVTFSVADTGIGIEPEHQERIWEEFVQVDNPVQRRVRGTGLGLPLSRKLAELLGGRVWVQTAPEAGSTFYLSLPLRLPEAGEPEPEERPAAAEEAAEEQILIVDDDDTSRYVMRRLLASVPCRIVEAAGGEEGLRLARERGVRAIFLDLVMGDLTGFQVLDRLKADAATRDIPVVVVTSKLLDEEERRRLAPQTAAILSKLVPGGELASSTREALQRAGLVARP